MFEITRLPMKKLLNTRDLGGFPAADGKTVRSGRLIRSGELWSAAPEDLQALKKLGVALVVDFRTSLERSQHPDPEIPGAVNLHLPILDESTVGVTKEQEQEDGLVRMLTRLTSQPGGAEAYMAGVYGDIIESSFARSQYRRFFELLLGQREGAVLWHCSAGKDRAGTGAALVLTALGVSRELVMEDYLKVNAFTAPVIDLLAEEVLRKTGSAEAAQASRDLTGARPEYLQSVLNRIDRDFGGMDAFLRQEMGLDAEKLGLLRDMYLMN